MKAQPRQYGWCCSSFRGLAHLCEIRTVDGRTQGRVLCGRKLTRLSPACGNNRCRKCQQIDELAKELEAANADSERSGRNDQES